MINKIILGLFILVVFASCNDTPLLTEKQSLNQEAITACKDKPCPQVSVDYISYSGEEEIIQPINATIEQFVISSLYLGDPEAKPTASSSKEAINQFINDYWRDTSEFPEINEYEAEVSIVETFRSQDLATVAMRQYSYAGGAHGYGSLQYVNFDIGTGEILTIDQLIKDKKGLASLAEKQLRKEYKIPETENLNAEMFWFENDTFYLSKNIGFENDKLIIHYNQYEIASYADGPIDIELSLNDVAVFLNYSIE